MVHHFEAENGFTYCGETPADVPMTNRLYDPVCEVCEQGLGAEMERYRRENLAAELVQSSVDEVQSA